MIHYSDTLSGLAAGDLHGFFAGWVEPPSTGTHLKLLQNSDHILLAFDSETSAVVAFTTAISDGVLSAYIPLLEVLPAYQGVGIGTELARRMLEKLSGLYMVDLICDPELQPFYERLGMQPAGGMVIRNYSRQSG